MGWMFLCGCEGKAVPLFSLDRQGRDIDGFCQIPRLSLRMRLSQQHTCGILIT